jgi:TetR/AcrR family transcriptional regulator
MSVPGEPGSRRGREHNAKGTREAILNAAEAVFAEHGFDGARIDAIAARSGYNKSLLFQYFGDKLGLYVEVLKRIDREITELQARFIPMLEDETIASNADTFKAFLETGVGALFDFLLEHPRYMRMLTWEMAEGWQTYAKIGPQMNIEDIDQFETLFHPVQSAGLLRSGFVPVIQMSMVWQICQSYLAYLPLYQMLLPGKDVSSAVALARAREYIVAFVVSGMMIDPPETKP